MKMSLYSQILCYSAQTKKFRIEIWVSIPPIYTNSNRFEYIGALVRRATPPLNPLEKLPHLAKGG